jgi:ADP-heptose:LPS heptosyltransferase
VVERAGENRAATWVRLAHLLGISAERHAPRLEPDAEAARQALGQLHSTGIADGRLLVALAPGTGYSDLHGLDPAVTAWDTERWAHLANQLAVRHGAGVIFLGTAEDEEAVQTAGVDVAAPHADLCGELDIIGTAALLGLCDLVVSADSPLLHLAAAVGTPAVGLFGPTSGRRRGPYGEEHRVIQAIAPQGQPDPAASGRSSKPTTLMGRIRVEDVLAGIETSL